MREAYFYLDSSFSKTVRGSMLRTHIFWLKLYVTRQAVAFFFFKKYLFLLASRLLFLKIHMAFYRYGSNFQIRLSKNSSNGNILGENHNVATEAHRVLFY